MKRVDRLKNDEIYVKMTEMLTIANKAVKSAKEENERLGIPDTFSKNGKIYFVLPNGEITTERPEIMK